MTRSKTIAVLALGITLAAGSAVQLIGRGADAPAPAATQRAADDILKDLSATSARLRQAMPGMAFFDPAARNAAAPAAVPLFRKMAALLGELATTQTDPQAKTEIIGQQHEYYAYLVAFNDKDALSLLQNEANAPGDLAIRARSAIALGQWWQNFKDPAAQQKVLDGYAAVAKAHPSDDSIVETLGNMWQLGAANPDLAQKVIDIVKNNMTGDAAQSLLATAESVRAQHDLIGKPLVVSGRTSIAGTFTSADLKGKVVLVDFWATWCGPCVAGLPDLKKLYADYHAKGLEIVGIDHDASDDTVNTFAKANQLPWTQLRDTSQNEGETTHPIDKLCHVDQFPTMFLIDKNGILRDVDADDGAEAKVKTLLAEASTTQPAK